MTSRATTTGVMLAAVLVASAGLVGSSGSPAAQAAGAERVAADLPVVAVARSDAATGQSVTPNSRYEFAVHGVHRYDGGTAAYFSVRSLPAHGTDELSDPRDVHWRRGNFGNVGYGISEASIAVPDRGELYTTLLSDEGAGDCLCTNARELDPDLASEWQTVYLTTDPLPADVGQVSLHLDGYGTVVHGVPVSDGLPQPQVDAGTVPAGEGWPAAPDAATVTTASKARTGGPVWQLLEPSGAVDDSWSATRSGDRQTIDIAADVLFETDEDEITGEADAALDQVAARVEAAGATQAEVVGHTDSEGADDYNDDLSQRRAQAVADELTERLPDVELTVEGRGESEPVASDDTEAGRASNRRVSVVSSGEAG